MTNLCPTCSAAIPADSPLGMCPQCMLADGVGESDVGVKPAGDGTEAPPSAEEIRPLFPHLQIVRMIGQGGMGAVYEARQRGLGRTVALKLLWAPKRFDAAFEQRFAREGQALAQLSHDNIVTVHDAGKSGPYYWLVMEYVDGANLRELLQRGRLLPAQALPMVTQICSALEYAHQQGIVHRDIKPENILIGVDGRLKVADFGLAKMLANDRIEPKLTQSFLQLGTPHYMAPEQLETPKDVDHRADIYSLGVVLYELLTGELPLGKFELPSRVVDVDPRFDGVVSKAMQKLPSRRYQAISDVQRAVQGIVESKGVARSTRTTSSSRSAAQWPVQIALTVLVAIGGVFLWRNLQSSRGATEASVSLDALFNAGRREVATPETLHAGVKKLEQVFDRDPDHEGVRDALRDAYQALAQQERRYSRHIEAASLLRKASEVSRSPLPPNLVEAVEREASEELRGLFHFVEPDASKPLGAKQVELVGSVDEKVQGEITIAGALVIPKAGRIRHPVGGLREGPNPIEVRLKRPGELQVGFTIHLTVDTIEPTLELTAPKAASIVKLPVKLSGRVKDSSAVRVTCLDRSATPDANGEWSLLLDGLDEGPAELEVTAIDAGGLRGTERRSIEVDSAPPQVSVKGGPGVLATRSAFLTVRLQASDANLKSAMVGSLEIPIESDGSFQVNVAAGDADGESRTTIVIVGDSAGNTTPFELVVFRDMTPPVVKLDADSADLFPGSSFQLLGTIDDKSECLVSVGGGVVRAVDGRFALPPVSVPREWTQGTPFLITGEARDAAGNTTSIEAKLPVYDPCANCQPVDGRRGDCKWCSGLCKRVEYCSDEKCRNNPKGEGVYLCTACAQRRDSAPECNICRGDGLCTQCRGTGYADRELVKAGSGAPAVRKQRKSPAKVFAVGDTWTGKFRQSNGGSELNGWYDVVATVTEVEADRVRMSTQIADYALREYVWVVEGDRVILSENVPTGLKRSGLPGDRILEMSVSGTVSPGKLTATGTWDYRQSEDGVVVRKNIVELVLQSSRAAPEPSGRHNDGDEERQPKLRPAGDAQVAVVSTHRGRLEFCVPVGGFWSSPVEIGTGFTHAAIAVSNGGVYEVIGLRETSLLHFRSTDGKTWTRGGLITVDATGPGAITLSKFGNLLVVVPERGGLVHYWTAPGKAWQQSNVVTLTATKAATIAIGPGGNHEVLALHDLELTHYWWEIGGASWRRTGVVTNQASACGSITRGFNGNFEVAVLEGSVLRHYWARPKGSWNRGPVLSSRATGVGAITTTLGKRLEVVVPEGNSLVHYWADARQPWVRTGEVMASDGKFAAAAPIGQ
jgi:serine/threonine protein kinase